MRRRIISLFSALLIAVLMLPAGAVTAHADHKEVLGQSEIKPEQSGIADMYDSDGGLFTSTEEDALEALIQDCAEKLQLNIVVYISGTRKTATEAEIFADDTYDQYYGEDTDGVFYYMDLSGQSPAHDYISTSGKAVLLYQDHIEDIFTTLDTYLPPSTVKDYADYKDDISAAVRCFLSQLDKYYSEGISNPFAYYYDKSSGKYFYFKNGKYMMGEGKPRSVKLLMWGISAAVGLVVGLIVYFANKRKYRFKSSADPGVYVSKSDTRFTLQNDRFIRTHTSRTRIESSSSGGSRGGGGGGHSFSGGHGGGGHSR